MGKKRRKPEKRAVRRPATAESQTSEAATIAWTVAVTMVVACDLAAIAAHIYVLNNPEATRAASLGALMLLAGAIVGAGAMAFTPVVYRLRRIPPPTGFVVFAACASAAPILAIIARALQ